MGRQRDRAGGDSRSGGKGLPPSLRPSKVCPVCGRPFSWRRKWTEVWDQVIYCSERCRNRRGQTPTSC
ncbi:MAG: DUF2256 domain-containing protein [Vulcanococcus sp.]